MSCNARGGRWGEYSLRKAFLRDCKRVGVLGWTYHDLRHFFVTALFAAGVPARVVQELAGHANLATTQRYAHVVERDLEQAINRLGNKRVTDSP